MARVSRRLRGTGPPIAAPDGAKRVLTPATAGRFYRTLYLLVRHSNASRFGRRRRAFSDGSDRVAPPPVEFARRAPDTSRIKAAGSQQKKAVLHKSL